MRFLSKNRFVSSFLTVVLLSVFACFSYSQEESSDIALKSITSLVIQKNYAEARKKLEQVIDSEDINISEETKADLNITMARVLYWQNEDIDRIIKLLEDQLDNTNLSDSTRLRVYWFLIRLYNQKFNYDMAIYYSQKSVNLTHNQNDEIRKFISLQALNIAYSASGKSDLANKTFKELKIKSVELIKTPTEKWVNLIEKTLTNDLNSYEKLIFEQQAYSGLAFAYTLGDAYEDSENFAKRAIEVANITAFPKSTLLISLGNIQAFRGEFQTAENSYSQALSLYENENRLTYIDKAFVELSVGLYYYEIGNSKEAQAHFLKSMEQQPKLIKRIDTVFLQAAYFYKLSRKKEQSTYLDQSKKKPAYWHPKSKEIIIYLPPNPEIAEWKPKFDEAVKSAFARWNQVLNNRFKFVFTSNPNIYDVKISWKKNAKALAVVQMQNMPWWSIGTRTYEKAGQNSFGVNSKHFIMNDIEIALNSSSGTPYQERCILHTILHEVGHCMGLKDHSPFPGDIMHEGGLSALRDLELSQRDIESLKELYSLPPVYTNDPARHVSQLYKTLLSFNAIMNSIEY